MLGRGGMGAVYRARQLPLGRPVAIKVLTGIAEARPELGARFEREALALSRLDHPNCIGLLDYGITDEHRRYLVMPLLEGTELRAMMGTPMVPARAVALVRQILLGLEHAHRRGVVHRDLKPENVFVTVGDHGEEIVKLVDFGLAKLLEDTDDRQGLTRAGFVFGTPMYMSPEQAAGGLIDEGTDLYAAGVLLYELLCGKPPFDTQDVVMLLRQQMLAPVPPLPDAVPAELRRVVERLLEKDRGHRFADARLAREALERCPVRGVAAAPGLEHTSWVSTRPNSTSSTKGRVALGGAALAGATQPTRELPPLGAPLGKPSVFPLDRGTPPSLPSANFSTHASAARSNAPMRSNLRITLDMERPEPRTPARRGFAPAGVAALLVIAVLSWSSVLLPSADSSVGPVSMVGGVELPADPAAPPSPAPAAAPAAVPAGGVELPADAAAPSSPTPAAILPAPGSVTPTPAPPPSNDVTPAPASSSGAAPKAAVAKPPASSAKRSSPRTEPAARPERIADVRPTRPTPAPPRAPRPVETSGAALPGVDAPEPRGVLRAQRPARTTTDAASKASLLPRVS